MITCTNDLLLFDYVNQFIINLLIKLMKLDLSEYLRWII